MIRKFKGHFHRYGIYFVITEKNYYKFINPSGMVGREDGQFVFPGFRHFKKVSISSIESKLGLIRDPTDKMVTYMVFKLKSRHRRRVNLRSPNSNHSGANSKFVLGGLTIGNIVEGIVDKSPASYWKLQYYIRD